MKTNEGKADDHVMTPQEISVTGAEIQERDMQYFIDTLKGCGLPVLPEWEARLRTLRLNKKTLQYLSQITDPAALDEAMKRIKSGDLPPEVFSTDDNFVVEGPETRQ
jgi:hypothetical protein